VENSGVGHDQEHGSDLFIWSIFEKKCRNSRHRVLSYETRTGVKVLSDLSAFGVH
jgi:hypothetical protein